MGEDLEQRLAEATARLRELELTNAQALGLERRQFEIEVRIAKLKEAYASEERDVERLEGVTFTRIVASLRGVRDERLTRERAEVEAARYRMAEAVTQLEAVKRDVMVRSRINQARENVAQYVFDVDTLEDALRQRQRANGRRLAEIEVERRQHLTAE